MTSKLCARPCAIDLSHHNQIVGSSYSAALTSLGRLKESGVLGLIHKATEGATYTDDKLKARCDLCRDAGMLFGSYCFLRPGSMGNQVAFYYDTVMSVQKIAGEADAWLWAADYEDPNIPLSQVADFMEQLEAVIGKPPVLYSGFAVKDKIAAGQDASRLTRFFLWLAHYNSTPTLPKGWDKLYMHQYSDKASVPGIVAPTDVNAAWEGVTEDEFIAEWTGEAAPPMPEPPDDGGDTTTVTVNIEAPPGVTVEVTVNGKEV